MKKQAKGDREFSAYDKATSLIRDQTAALKACHKALAECQAENLRLIEGYRFYADRDGWRTRAVQMDNGAKAREILKEVCGE